MMSYGIWIWLNDTNLDDEFDTNSWPLDRLGGQLLTWQFTSDNAMT